MAPPRVLVLFAVLVTAAAAAEYATQDTYAVTTRPGSCSESFAKVDDGFEKGAFGFLKDSQMLVWYIHDPHQYDNDGGSLSTDYTTTWHTTSLPSTYNGVTSLALTYGDFTLTVTLGDRFASGHECSCIPRLQDGERPCRMTHYCDYHDFSASGSGWSTTVSSQSLASNKCFRTTVTNNGITECMTMCVPRTLCVSCRYDLERPWVITATVFMTLFFVTAVVAVLSGFGIVMAPLFLLAAILLAVTVGGLLSECDMQAWRECGSLCTILDKPVVDTWPVCTSF